jgi:hypothetical protein
LRGAPQPVVDTREVAMVQVMQSDAIKQRMGSVGFVIPAQGVKPYAAFMQSEINTRTQVIKVAGIYPQKICTRSWTCGARSADGMS